MNRIKYLVYPLATVLAFAAAAVAHAETPEPAFLAPPAFKSELTRDQVTAQYHQARKDGSLRVWSTQYNPLTGMKTSKTRAETRAEVLALQAQGIAQSMTGEDSGSFALARQRAVTVSGPLLAQHSAPGR